MRKSTDLDAVKGVARSFLYLPIKQNEKVPFILNHPFFSHWVVAVKQDGKETLLDLSKEDELKIAQNAIASIIDEVKAYREFLILLNKPYLPAFFKFSEKHLGLADFSSFLGALWTYVEFPNSDATVSKLEFIRFFHKADKAKVMEPEEYEAYSKLPNEVVVYRGVAENGTYKALSWTMDKEKAKWFSKRFSVNGILYSATVNKEDIFAFFSCRSEDEIVLDYRKLIDVKREE